MTYSLNGDRCITLDVHFQGGVHLGKREGNRKRMSEGVEAKEMIRNGGGKEEWREEIIVREDGRERRGRWR